VDLKFDIETIPGGNPDEIEVKVPANYKNPDVIEKYIAENRDTEFRKRALNGLTGEIISIAWQRQSDPIQSITRNTEWTERWLLEEFFGAITNFGDLKYPRLKWIGHNSLEFDLRYLKQRCWVNRVNPGVMIPADAKHGDWAFDVMKEWAGWKGYVSQDALYRALGGQPYEDDSVDGSMVYDLWLAGEYDKIRDYNIRDVKKLAFNYERLTQ
jgi:hypothetical protein